MLLINIVKKNDLILFFLLILFIFFSALILSGCAKTGYPQAPTIPPPPAPNVISIKKNTDSLVVIYKYQFNPEDIKEFLIYEKRFKNKTKKNLSCSQSKLVSIQNLKFADKFRLNKKKGGDLFFYKIDKSALKKGYYFMLCIKSKNYFGIKSAFSNFLTIRIN